MFANRHGWGTQAEAEGRGRGPWLGGWPVRNGLRGVPSNVVHSLRRVVSASRLPDGRWEKMGWAAVISRVRPSLASPTTEFHGIRTKAEGRGPLQPSAGFDLKASSLKPHLSVEFI